MMKNSLPVIAMVSVILFSCSQPQTRVAHELWYKQTKEAILHQSALEPDSVWYTFNQDSSYKTIWQYHEHHLITKRGFNKSIFRYESNFSKNGLFELRREMCDNGKIGFEGIFYKTKAYGLSTWYDCQDHPVSQGVRFNGEKIGNWKSWKSPKEAPTEEEHGNQLPLDSFPVLKGY
ncbi:MAG: hypothetical protein JO154_11105 [Chitinophaga sp.]|uniref:hypothetical protein n=1 Tax=Chitinophaga sp. TaxID=1869181 RepID=UPI0025C1584F|nr:hypothetical protein [Chitinophaga sp.]MBV8253145.1 hypothetical protein [Chitinophaga sp.]